MLFYQAKLVLCRFVATKFSPFVEYAGKSNAAVTQADCIVKSVIHAYAYRDLVNVRICILDAEISYRRQVYLM
jgi:hypothetical protein